MDTVKISNLLNSRDSDSLVHAKLTSSRKRETVALNHGENVRVYTRGSAELVLERCSKIVGSNASVEPLDAQK